MEYTRLNYEYLCNRRHVVHFGQLSSTCLAFVLRCSCVLANVIVVAALLGAGLSVSENLNCPNIRYEFSRAQPGLAVAMWEVLPVLECSAAYNFT